MLQTGLPKNVKIAVAVSGGVDSVVLLHQLVGVAGQQGFSLSVVHCEHGIRGEESIADARFVETLAEKYGLPFVCFSEDCPALACASGESLETAARNFRYRCFEKVLASGVDYVALAHHKDDAVETALFRLSRGTSLGGVLGMSAVSGRYLRPLLETSKQEILAYAAEHGLEYRQDCTNLDRDATRNRLRLDVIPALCDAVPGAGDNLISFAKTAKEDDEFLYALSEELIVQETPRSSVDTGLLVKLAPPPLLRRACLTVLKRLGLEKDYTKKHLQAVCDLGSLQTGARVVLPKGIVAVRRYDAVGFLVGEKQEEFPVYPFEIGEFAWGRYAVTVSNQPIMQENALRVDLAKIPDGAVIRARGVGDVFRKFGGGTKSLKKYLIDKKVPLEARDGLPLLAVGKEILAVFGVEISENVRVDENTKETAYLAVKNNEGV